MHAYIFEYTENEEEQIISHLNTFDFKFDLHVYSRFSECFYDTVSMGTMLILSRDIQMVSKVMAESNKGSDFQQRTIWLNQITITSAQSTVEKQACNN